MTQKHYFVAGIGGSGMLPLAILLKGMGHRVSGSDRSFDQGRTPEKFAWIKAQGIDLFPQDGSGITSDIDAVLISKAVEDTVPDIRVAKDKNIPIKLRVDMMVELFNAAKRRIAIAGTSGKTTTTGMTGFILKECGMDPTVMNGGIFKNYAAQNPYSTAFVGAGDIFVTEMDESDGIEYVQKYNPEIAVLHNITLDHQSMEELEAMFRAFISKAKTVILNADDEKVLAVAKDFIGRKITYGLHADADIHAVDMVPMPDGVVVYMTVFGQSATMKLRVPGKHNVSNALAALGAVMECGVPLDDAVKTLESFTGIKRRLDVIGTCNGITVIDDFAHNPDKVTATLNTLKEFDGRLVMFFQPHGYGFLKMVGPELAQAFADGMGADDVLYLVEPFYAGGTVDRSVGSQSLVDAIKAQGKQAQVVDGREDVAAEILSTVKPGDRVIVMGARDDSLTTFAQSILEKLQQNQN